MQEAVKKSTTKKRKQSMTVTEGTSNDNPTHMILGAAYNVFDGEELLEASIRSIHTSVDYIVIVYQTTSNFGEKCSHNLVQTLESLKEKGLVDDIVHYEPRSFNKEERRKMISPYSDITGAVQGGIESIAEQFLNELAKRDIGREYCERSGCNFIMSMDCDEFYLEKELANVKKVMIDEGYDGAACKMRYYYKDPTYELQPPEELNHVPLMLKLRKGSKYCLAHPYPCLVDPTRTLSRVRRFKLFDRDSIEMHHMSLVRKNIRSKVTNVSNRANYTQVQEFLQHFEKFQPGDAVAYPHPYFKFTNVIIRPNQFDIKI